MRTPSVVITLAMLFLFMAAACGGYESSTPDTRICRARLEPRTFHYTIVNDILHVQDTGEAMTRISSIAENQDLRIYGTWNVGSNRYPGQRYTLDMRFEPNKATAIARCDYGTAFATVEASSPAVITGSTVEILELAETIEEIPATE